MEEGKRRRKEIAASTSSSEFNPPLSNKSEEDDGGVDRISRLPDCILGSSILSLLPIEDAARTSILSSRWRDLWSVSPIHIIRNDDDRWCIGTIISRHCGPILSFRLSYDICMRVLKDDPFILDRWMETLAQKGIQNLTLHSQLPSSGLACCQSLRSIELIDGSFDESLPTVSLPEMMPPNLRELKLRDTILTDGSLSRILSRCRFLDSLELVACSDLETMRIRSPSLRKLKVHILISTNAPVLLIEDAPNLELLMLHEFIADRIPLKVFSAPKLRQLGVVRADAKLLQFGETHFQREMPINLTSHVHSLETLTIRVNLCDAHHAKTLAGLLRCFPCLETLNVLSDDWLSTDLVDSEYWEREGSSDCLNCHLKYVKIRGFLGDDYDLSFAKFLVRNMQVLVAISLICCYSYLAETGEETRLLQLGFASRASLDAQVIFLTDEHEDNISIFD